MGSNRQPDIPLDTSKAVASNAPSNPGLQGEVLGKDTAPQSMTLQQTQQKIQPEFACFACEAVYQREIDLMCHAKYTGHSLQCATCLLVVHTLYRMGVHLASCHPDVHFMRCEGCKKLFPKVKLWRKHTSWCSRLKAQEEVISDDSKLS